jgi:hypothetical protein
MSNLAKKCPVCRGNCEYYDHDQGRQVECVSCDGTGVLLPPVDELENLYGGDRTNGYTVEVWHGRDMIGSIDIGDGSDEE